MGNVAVITVPLEQWENLTDKVNQIFKLIGKTENTSELLTPNEVLKVLKIGRSTFDRYVREGILPTKKISQKKGSRIYVERSELDKIIENGLI